MRTINEKSYSELLKFDNFLDRYRYLRLGDKIGDETFGYDRYINQIFYHSPEWRSFRNEIIIRDNGCDLGIDDYEIHGLIIIHHINPITKNDILFRDKKLMDPENVICVSDITHKAIHYGDESLLPIVMDERYPYDTIPWR